MTPLHVVIWANPTNLGDDLLEAVLFLLREGAEVNVQDQVR